MSAPVLAIGLMSGTSLDGIDAALIETDGEAQVRAIAFVGIDYSDAQRELLNAATQAALAQATPAQGRETALAEGMLTRAHANAVARLLDRAGVRADAVRVVGYHGQTVAHRPDRGWTWQLGDGAGLAQACGIDVVADFRSADVAAGGQGAPLLPVYHAALCAALPKPVGVLNLGGVANITFVGENGELVAFDTGPANGLVDSWIEAHTGARFDAGGALAASGRVDETVVTAMLDHPYFDLPAPKSLDRNDFTIQPARGLSVADGAATLVEFTARSVAEGLQLLPDAPRRLFVAGGGRHNPFLLARIAAQVGIVPEPAEALGLDGDATEAEGFAYMAVRRLRGLPISFPGTTGVGRPLPGGVLHAHLASGVHRG